MKRKNPKTGKPFKYGEQREDGKVFRTYTSEIKLDGYFKEVWHSKSTFEKQHLAQKEKAKEWRNKRSKERREMLNEIKVRAGCEICGFKGHPAALDFDHLYPESKGFDISKRYVFSNIDRLFEEIKKCRVLCANCHRIHSKESGHNQPKRRKIHNDRIKKIIESWS